MLFKKKQTDFQFYPRRKSKHPQSLKCSIPYAQALRLRWVLTKDHDFKANYDILSKKLIVRGYKKAEIYDNISKTLDRNREDLLTQNYEPEYRISLTFFFIILLYQKWKRQ